MVDKRFTIADLTERYSVTLNIPPTKHDDQFTERELLTTRKIASLKIHIEQAIGKLKTSKSLMTFQTMSRVADQTYFCLCNPMLCMFDPPLCSK